jgi:hypothetical protein
MLLLFLYDNQRIRANEKMICVSFSNLLLFNDMTVIARVCQLIHFQISRGSVRDF